MAIFRIEHEPAGVGFFGPRHLLADNVVGCRFIQIALARLIDHHRARQCAFDGAQPPAIFARNIKHRRRPRRLHVQRFGTGRNPGPNAVAGIAARAARIERVAILGRKFVAHRLVLVEPACGKDHALACADPHFLAIVVDDGAGDPPLGVPNKVLHGAFQPQRNTLFLQREPQSARQRVAQRQPPILARFEPERPIEPIARQALGQMPPPARRAEQDDVGFVKMPVEIAKQGRRRRGIAQGLNVLAQLPTVDRQGHMGTVATGRTTRIFSMIIGVGKGLIIDLGIGPHPAQHRCGVFDKGPDVRVGDILG